MGVDESASLLSPYPLVLPLVSSTSQLKFSLSPVDTFPSASWDDRSVKTPSKYPNLLPRFPSFRRAVTISSNLGTAEE